VPVAPWVWRNSAEAVSNPRLSPPDRPVNTEGMDDRENRTTDEFGCPWWWGPATEVMFTLIGLIFAGVLIWVTIWAIGLFWRPFD